MYPVTTFCVKTHVKRKERLAWLTVAPALNYGNFASAMDPHVQIDDIMLHLVKVKQVVMFVPVSVV